MSLRTSAHTGAAIRFPRRETWQLGTTSGKFVVAAYSPKVLLSAMYCRRGCGLPRRSAPRNDSGETSLHPRTRPSFCMSLRASAWGAPQRGTLCGERSHKGALPCSGLWPEQGMADFGATRCGNPRPRRETCKVGTTLGKSVALPRIRLRRCSLLCAAAGERIVPSLRSSQ